MQKLTIIVTDLGYGGIEKSVVSLANALIKYYQVEILVVNKSDYNPAFIIDERIKIKYLCNFKFNNIDIKSGFKILNFFKIIKESFAYLRLSINKEKKLVGAINACHSQIIIGTQRNINKLLGKYKGKGIKTIAWEQNHPNGNIKTIKELRDSCKNIDKLVVVSKEIKDIYERDFQKNNIKCQVEIIPSFLEKYPNQVNKLDNKNIVSIGKLEAEKGFLDLINIYKLIELKDGDAYLNIVGNGTLRNKIFKTIVNNNLSRKVRLHGYVDSLEVNNIYKESSLYLMTSYTESAGLVLLEAMSYGIPVIAFDNADSAKYLIKDGYNGYLIKNRNEHEMVAKTIKLFQNRELLKKMGANARNISEEYAEEVIIQQWLELFKNM